jgi:hypothetical protein
VSNAKQLLMIPAMLLLLAGVCACAPGTSMDAQGDQQDIQVDQIDPIAGSQDDGLNDTDETDETTTSTDTARNAPAPRKLAISTTSLGTWRVGEDNDKMLRATGGSGRYTWEAVGLPSGIELENNYLRGTPARVERRSVTIIVSDKADPEVSVEKALTLTVSEAVAEDETDADTEKDPAPAAHDDPEPAGSSGGNLTITAPSVVSVDIGKILNDSNYAISIKAVAASGTPPYAWSMQPSIAGQTWPMTRSKGRDCLDATSSTCTFTLKNVRPNLIDPFEDPSISQQITVSDADGATVSKKVVLKTIRPPAGSTDIRATIPTGTADNGRGILAGEDHLEIFFYDASDTMIAKMRADNTATYDTITHTFQPINAEVEVVSGRDAEVSRIARITVKLTQADLKCSSDSRMLRADTTFADRFWAIKLEQHCGLTCYKDDPASAVENDELFEENGYIGKDITNCLQKSPTDELWQRIDVFAN